MKNSLMIPIGIGMLAFATIIGIYTWTVVLPEDKKETIDFSSMAISMDYNCTHLKEDITFNNKQVMVDDVVKILNQKVDSRMKELSCK